MQHLESVNDVVERITGVKQHETIPDAVVRAAEQVELVDMTPEALRRRMAHGNIYPSERIDASLANYFRPGNLAALRSWPCSGWPTRSTSRCRTTWTTTGSGSWRPASPPSSRTTGAPGGKCSSGVPAMAMRADAELFGVHVGSNNGSPARPNSSSTSIGHC